MKAVLRLVFAAAATAILTPAALAAHTHVPTPSTWQLNVGESDFAGGPSMKSDRMMLLTDTDKWLKYKEDAVYGDGTAMKSSWSGPQDGTLRPVTGMPGAKASYNTAEDTGHQENPDGSVMDWSYSMSGEKKAIFKMKFKAKDGKVYDQTLIYYRVK